MINNKKVLLYFILFLGGVILGCNSEPTTRIFRLQMLNGKEQGLILHRKHHPLPELNAGCLEYGMSTQDVICGVQSFTYEDKNENDTRKAKHEKSNQ